MESGNLRPVGEMEGVIRDQQWYTLPECFRIVRDSHTRIHQSLIRVFSPFTSIPILGFASSMLGLERKRISQKWWPFHGDESYRIETLKNHSKRKKNILVLKVNVPSIMLYDVHPLIDNTFLSGLYTLDLPNRGCWLVNVMKVYRDSLLIMASCW